ncbi:hypothetical protein B0H17DRAFT_1220588 [Mycena rosella]|uniref:Uncharacterized protein n=1 Tax=Mycena rosella TaxID=1033263 RepID=A0AAD7B9E2_MYCRO|nr:hypothetical protein B0H17DRAFT_1220588 [Mycena rosella]
MPINNLPVEMLNKCFHFYYGSFTDDTANFCSRMLAIYPVNTDLSAMLAYAELAGERDFRIHIELLRPLDAIYDMETSVSSSSAAFLTSLATILETLLPRAAFLHLESVSSVQTLYFVPLLCCFSCPCLRKLNLNLTSMVLKDAPVVIPEARQVTHLCVRNTLYARISDSLFVTVTALMIVNLSDMPFQSDFVRIFRATPLLTFLHLEGTDCEEDDNGDDAPINLPFLAHVHFGRAAGQTVGLACQFRALALSYLMLSCLTHEELELVVKAATAWCSTVQYLTFPSLITTGPMLTRVL